MNKSRWRAAISAAAAMSSLVACFPRTATIVPENVRTNPTPVEGTKSNPGAGEDDVSTDPSVSPVTMQTPLGSEPVDPETPSFVIDKPGLAAVKMIALTDATLYELPHGTHAAVEVKYLSSEATPSQTTKLTLALASEWPEYYKDLNHFPLARQLQTTEGITYYETAKVDAVDETKRTITFTPKGNGVYVVVPSEQEPEVKQDFPYYDGIEGRQTYQYDPVQDKFIVGSSGTHTSSRPYYSILTDADIASASVLFSPGDGHDKEAGDWHALKFYRYAYNYAKPEDRAWAWKRMVPMVVVYDTRSSIDTSAELAAPYANMRIGFSYGALRNRAGRAIANKIMANQPFASREAYLHHFGDISWAGEHLGIKIADPKAWRASTQGRPYATGLALAHGAFFHNLSTSLSLRPLKNMEDPIRDLGVSWLAYGHRSFFPPARRYPIQYPFITFFRFGRIGGIPLPEELSPDDAYSIPCSEASEHFKSAVEATRAVIGGECRYNFFQALEWMEERHGASREIRYSGFFSNISELIRAHREFMEIVAKNVTDAVQSKDRSTATTRQSLAWMQGEQSLLPHAAPCGDGLADCASALGYEGSEPIFIRTGSQLDLNYGALERAKPNGIDYRIIKNASHADFAGKGSDDPHTFTDAERAIYDSTLADLRAYDAAALPTGTYTLSNTDARSGMGEYLGRQSGYGWSYDSPPVRTGPDRFEFTYWVEVRVPEAFHYVDERDDFYIAKFRWYNGRWWLDGEKPQYQYSRYANR